MSNKLQDKASLRVNIRSRKEVMFDSFAYSITSVNKNGFFDILPFHANMVSLIEGTVVVDKGLPTERSIKVDKGILTVLADSVKVYLGI